MIGVNIEDVMHVINTCLPYLIGFGVVLLAAIVITIAVRKMPKPRKRFARAQAWIVTFVSFVLVVNLLGLGPLKSLLSLATADRSTPTDETVSQALDTSKSIAEEGIVLLQNDNDTLPLASGKLNVFGWASIDPIYGGTGTGSISDSFDKVTLLEGIQDADIEVNQDLVDFYNDYATDRSDFKDKYGSADSASSLPEGVEAPEGMDTADLDTSSLGADWNLPEPAASTYSDELIEGAKDFSDTALIVLARSGGEGNDLPTNMATEMSYVNNSSDYNDFEFGESYLDLTQTERDMIDLVCANFDNVIVLYDGANTMPLGWVENYPQIKSVLYFAGSGQNGFDALGEVLTGAVNPSGKTADTFVYDLTQTPTYNNFGDFKYDNMDEFQTVSAVAGMPGNTPTYVNDVEGIYVGYRFYETADDEGLIDYDSTVQYPFGYGLSYTTFSQKMGDISTAADGTISFDVTVTNTGNVAGKDVVEVYYNPPYENGGIEKASANLVAFDKTDELEPGESQTVSISFNEEDMASYDENHANSDGTTGCYVLEDGNYEISINSDAHDVIDSRTWTLDQDIVYDAENPRSTDQTAATNQFSDEGGYDSEGDVTYLSRADHFANYDEATAAPTTNSMPDEYKATFTNTANFDADAYEDPNAEMPTTGADNGVELAELRGLSYDDDKWNSLLDEMSVDDMNTLIGLSGYQTSEIDSIGKVKTLDCDGPAAINNLFTGKGSIGMPTNTTVACTWNEDLALEFGEVMGQMAADMNVWGWYGPAMNTHRSAFAGRNFEYFSEDGVLAGKLAAQQVKGAAEKGVYSYIKHFALNEQETNRNNMICTWATEQSIREIYLKPFEYCVKDGNAKAVMSSYVYIGTTWAGAYDGLLNSVLRDEWGFEGMVLTDAFMSNGYMNADAAIRNGGDTILANYDSEDNRVHENLDTASTLQYMRKACHNILYTVVNSGAYENYSIGGLENYQIALIAIDAVSAALVVFLEVKAVRKLKASEADAK